MDTNWFVFIAVVFALSSFVISSVGSITDEDLETQGIDGIGLQEESLEIDYIVYNISVPDTETDSWFFNISQEDDEFHIEEEGEDILTKYFDLENNMFGFESYNWTTEPTLFFFSNKLQVETLLVLNEPVEVSGVEVSNLYDTYDIDIRDNNEELITEGGFFSGGFISSITLPPEHISNEYSFDDFYFMEESTGFIDTWFGDIPFLHTILSSISNFMDNFISGLEELPVWFNTLYFGTFVLIGSWLAARMLRGN